MIWTALILLVVTAHLSFVVLIPAGWLVILKPHRAVTSLLHGLASVWAALSSALSLPCPLTRAEMLLRHIAGWNCFHESFLDHYCVPVLRSLHVAHAPEYGILWPLSAIFSVALHAYLLHCRRSAAPSRPNLAADSLDIADTALCGV